MFKKSLAALAVLGTFAGFASAADVNLYGVVDYGVIYTHTKAEATDEADVSTHKFAMDSGVSAGSRFGIKGVEDLGNGMKVGFKLENGFNADDGTLGQNSRLFGREASLSFYTDFGTISMGRMGGVGSGAGTYDLVFGTADAFDGGDNNVFGLASSSRMDNMITYQSPKFSGVQATVQYSFKADNKKSASTQDGELDPTAGQENTAATDRYAAVALTGDFGALQTVVAYEFTNVASNGTVGGNHVTLDRDDSHVVYVGGNYDVGSAKLFALVQYFHGYGAELGYSAGEVDTDWSQKGYGLHFGTIVPVAGGDLTVGFYHVNAKPMGYAENEAIDSDAYKIKFTGAAAKYEYTLSKRTSLYTGAGVWQKKMSDNEGYTDKDTGIQAYAGMTHRF